MADARFEDGDEAPLHLVARDAEDLAVIATLVQDAVFPIAEMRFLRGQRRFALLLNRFRWEDRAAAEKAERAYERVQSLLLIEDVMSIRTQGIDRTDAETVLSLLDLSFVPTEDGMGVVSLTLAGDGAIELHVEALEAALKDVTRPYIAPSRQAPSHPE